MRPPLTGTGVVWSSTEPLPSRSFSPHPQQYATPEVARPQVWLPPALMEAKVKPPLTGTGVLGSGLVEPLPSWPTPLPPQQYAAPTVVIPQVWIKPVLMEANVNPPLTGTGSAWSSVEPLPSWPKRPQPQQYAAPEVVTPQVWIEPALMDPNVRPPLTGTGVFWWSTEPLPSRPSSPNPQQNATPAVLTPQVWLPPALMEAKVKPPLTSTGVLRPGGLEPLPSCPSSPNPQQNATPVVLAPQVWLPPALMDEPVTVGGGSEGGGSVTPPPSPPQEAGPAITTTIPSICQRDRRRISRMSFFRWV